MKILVYGINYAPDLIGIAKYTAEMCQYLLGAGHDVRVVTAPPYYPDWKVPAPYKSRRYTKERIDQIPVVRCPLYVPSSQNALRRILHHFSFALTSGPAVVATAMKFRPDVILTVAPSLMSAPNAIVAARLSGASAWLHVQDFEIDAAFDLGFFSGSYFERAALRLERLFLRMFDVVSTISPKMMVSLKNKGVAPDRRVEFRNWVDTGAICPSNRHEALRRSLGIPPDATVALYSGNMGAKQGVEYLSAAAKQLLAHRPDIRFVVCGSGPMKERLRDMTAKLGNVILLDLQPAAKFHQLLTMADIHLLPQRPEINDSVLPGRLASMLASGRPIVAMANGGTQLCAEVEGAGIVVLPGDVDAFAAALVRLAGDPALRHALGAKGREYAAAAWDRAVILGHIEDKLLELCRNGSTLRPVHDADTVEVIDLQSLHNRVS